MGSLSLRSARCAARMYRWSVFGGRGRFARAGCRWMFCWGGLSWLLGYPACSLTLMRRVPLGLLVLPRRGHSTQMTEADEQRQLSLQSQAEASVSSSQAEASGFLTGYRVTLLRAGRGKRDASPGKHLADIYRDDRDRQSRDEAEPSEPGGHQDLCLDEPLERATDLKQLNCFTRQTHPLKSRSS